MTYLFVIWQRFKLLRLVHIRRYFFLSLFFLQAELVFCLQPHDTLFVISDIFISGNKVSKENIILKELSFKIGDSITENEIIERSEKSRENLLNTSLFNFVIITYSKGKGDELHINISVIERWYIWPSPIFEHAERNLGAFIHSPDWNRINYGGQIFWDNFRGRKERINLKIRLGYKEQYLVSFEKPNFGKNQQHGINFTLNSTRQHEVNVYSINNKPVYIKNENSYLAEFINPYIIYQYRSSLYSTHFLSFSYVGLTYRDSATHKEFTGLAYGDDPQWLIGEYIYEYDFRDSKTYPLKGDYFRINLKRRKFLSAGNSGFSKSSLLLNAMHHGRLFNRLYYNDALRMQLTRDIFEPKVYHSGLGYGPYLRGYELFVIDGNSYGLLLNNLKYSILQERSYNLANIPWSQFNPIHISFYANLFFDMAYVQGKYYGSDGNTYVNRILYTAGLGFDLVSYYDQVARFEISINREGQPGFFIHAEVPFSRW